VSSFSPLVQPSIVLLARTEPDPLPLAPPLPSHRAAPPLLSYVSVSRSIRATYTPRRSSRAYLAAERRRRPQMRLLGECGACAPSSTARSWLGAPAPGLDSPQSKHSSLYLVRRKMSLACRRRRARARSEERRWLQSSPPSPHLSAPPLSLSSFSASIAASRRSPSLASPTRAKHHGVPLGRRLHLGAAQGDPAARPSGPHRARRRRGHRHVRGARRRARAPADMGDGQAQADDARRLVRRLRSVLLLYFPLLLYLELVHDVDD